MLAPPRRNLPADRLRCLFVASWLWEPFASADKFRVADPPATQTVSTLGGIGCVTIRRGFNMHLQSLFLAVTMCHMAIAAAPRDVYYQGLLTPLNITPTFDKGYLFVHDAYKIDVFGPGGSHLNDVAAVVAKAKVVNIINAAADADGTTAGAVEYSFDGSTRTEHGGIAVFDSSGKQERFFDTALFSDAGRIRS